jgi:hypothetical protein
VRRGAATLGFGVKPLRGSAMIASSQTTLAVTFKIPKRLAHLAPVLEWISEIPEGELHEDTDMYIVDSFLRSRYGKRNVGAAEEVWETDRKVLEKLVEANGRTHSWLYFLQGYAYSSPQILADLLAEECQDETDQMPPLTLRVKLPIEFQVKSDFGSVLASHETLNATFVPTGEPVLDFKLQNLRHDAKRAEELSLRPDWPERVEYTFQTSNWGSVVGHKVTRKSNPPYSRKMTTYLLNVPGGACFIEVRCKNIDVDGSELERHFDTISIETNPNA